MSRHVPGRGAVADHIVVAVPVELKSLADSFQELVDATIAARRSGRGDHAMDYGEVEVTIAERTAAIERAAHTKILSSLDVDAPRVRIGGEMYTRIGREPGTYNTMAGPVIVERAVYRQEGVRNAPVVDAITLRTGAIGRGWLPWTAQAMADDVQRGTSREAEAGAKQKGRLPYSRVSFERVAHEVGKLWVRSHADIEDLLAQRFELPEAAHSVSASLDRVSLPMEEPAKKPRGRPRKDAPKRPVERNFRMAYCGSLTIHGEDGKALHTLRYGCMPQGDPNLLCAQMANEVYRWTEKRGDLRIKLLADGAPEMWNLLESNFLPEVFGTVERGVDFYHLIEKLSPAAKLIFGDDAGKPELRRWRRLLRRSSTAAATILEELRESGRENNRRNGQKPVHEAITYLENHAERMDYAAAIRQGLPIGSGNVEATCKTLVEIRMKRAGSRWKTETGEHILRLRALALSDRWEPGMSELHARRRTAVRPAA
jgi:hypothetical protein